MSTSCFMGSLKIKWDHICDRTWETVKRPNCPHCDWNNDGLYKTSRKEASLPYHMSTCRKRARVSPTTPKFRWKRTHLSLTEVCYHSIESEVHGKSKKQNRYFKRHLFKLVSTVMQGEGEPCHPVTQQNPQSPKHLVYTLLAEPQVPADGSGWSGRAKSRMWVFHQWSDLIWKFLQTPLSRKNTA